MSTRHYTPLELQEVYIHGKPGRKIADLME